jgi:hypothetical protein
LEGRSPAISRSRDGANRARLDVDSSTNLILRRYAAVHFAHKMCQRYRRGFLKVGAFVGCCFSNVSRDACAIAFSKMKSNLIKRVLFPLFCRSEPSDRFIALTIFFTGVLAFE